jgi:hypothetical protein
LKSGFLEFTDFCAIELGSDDAQKVEVQRFEQWRL